MLGGSRVGGYRVAAKIFEVRLYEEPKPGGWVITHRLLRCCTWAQEACTPLPSCMHTSNSKRKEVEDSLKYATKKKKERNVTSRNTTLQHTRLSLCLLHWWHRAAAEFRNKTRFYSSLWHPNSAPTALVKFLGRQVYSYGHRLFITFTSETPELLPDRIALLLEGSGIALSAGLSSHPVPGHEPGLAPQRSFIVRYKTAVVTGLAMFECVHDYYWVSLANIKVLACMSICLFSFESPCCLSHQSTHYSGLITAHPRWLCCHGPSGVSGYERGDEPAPSCAGCHVDLAHVALPFLHFIHTADGLTCSDMYNVRMH